MAFFFPSSRGNECQGQGHGSRILNPIEFPRVAGKRIRRYADRQDPAESFQLPPRATRYDPVFGPTGSTTFS